MENLLRKIYYDPKKSASFSSVHKLYKEASRENPKITLNEVKEWLLSQLTYTLHKDVKRKFPRNKIIVSYIDEQWEADLVDMQKYARYNGGNNYLLTVIDCFSKFAFVRCVHRKTSKNIINCFKDIFKIRVPHKLRTDRGKEFINVEFQKLLKEKKVEFFTSKDTKIKCAIVERFNRTLHNKISKYFTSVGKRKYLDVLQPIVSAYNNTRHTTIMMKPTEVSKENEKQVFKNIYKFNNLRELLFSEPKKRSNLKIGDKVRLQYEHKPFDKGYYPNWTDPVFIIEKNIEGNNQVVFRIKDYSGKVVEQKFYPEELQKIKENLYRVEKVLKKRTKNAIKEVYVKWLNYPESYNSWIPEKDITNIY